MYIIVEDMLNHMKELKPFSELENSVFSSLFLDYCVLGGMPAVVREFIKNKTFEGTLDIQRQSRRIFLFELLTN